jgi:hypothetical protein
VSLGYYSSLPRHYISVYLSLLLNVSTGAAYFRAIFHFATTTTTTTTTSAGDAGTTRLLPIVTCVTGECPVWWHMSLYARRRSNNSTLLLFPLTTNLPPMDHNPTKMDHNPTVVITTVLIDGRTASTIHLKQGSEQDLYENQRQYLPPLVTPPSIITEHKEVLLLCTSVCAQNP